MLGHNNQKMYLFYCHRKCLDVFIIQPITIHIYTCSFPQNNLVNKKETKRNFNYLLIYPRMQALPRVEWTSLHQPEIQCLKDCLLRKALVHFKFTSARVYPNKRIRRRPPPLITHFNGDAGQMIPKIRSSAAVPQEE